MTVPIRRVGFAVLAGFNNFEREYVKQNETEAFKIKKIIENFK